LIEKCLASIVFLVGLGFGFASIGDRVGRVVNEVVVYLRDRVGRVVNEVVVYLRDRVVGLELGW
jgi:hypothetical protein